MEVCRKGNFTAHFYYYCFHDSKEKTKTSPNPQLLQLR